MSFGPPDLGTADRPDTGGHGANVGTPPAIPGVRRYGPRERTRSAIAKGSSAKGANAERDVLSAFRDVMVNVEADIEAEGHTFVARSSFATRKRIEKGTSNRDLGNIPLISIEVKRREKLAVESWWEQAMRQADSGELPVLVYRANREPWTVLTWVACTDPLGRIVKYVRGAMSLPDFLAYYALIYREFLKGALT
jgi:hypothetical protein